MRVLQKIQIIKDKENPEVQQNIRLEEFISIQCTSSSILS